MANQPSLLSVTLVKMNLLELQSNEVLKAVQVGKNENVESVLFSLNEYLNSKLTNGQMVSEHGLQLKGIDVMNYIDEKEIVLEFKKMNRIDIIGSYMLQTCTKMKYSVDVAVEMPMECFLPKDFQNFRYYDKRALYLGVLAAELYSFKHELVKQVVLEKWTARKPIIRIELNSSKKGCACIRLFPVVDKSVFKLAKLLPNKGNVRHELVDKNGGYEPSPVYNNGILQDMNMTMHVEELHQVTSECEAMRKAIVLGKVWIYERGFETMGDSIDGFTVSMLYLYLLQKHQINLKMSAIQMFKVMMRFLATEKLHGGVFSWSTKNEDVHRQLFMDAFPITFLDSSGQYNIAGNWSASAIVELQIQAKASIELLTQASISAFQQLFITKSSFWTRYDQYIHIESPSCLDVSDKEVYNTHDQISIRHVGMERFWISKVCNILTRALTDRVSIIRPCLLNTKSTTWKIRSYPPKPRGFIIGLSYNLEQAGRLVDKGPSADDKVSAAEFRRFWKQKSDLRRFKDGTILEAVVWNRDVHERHAIIEDIVKYILPLHVEQIHTDSIVGVTSQFFTWMESENLGNTGEATLNLWRSFDSLATKLRELKTLPLSIMNILHSNAAFRYTAPKVPHMHPLVVQKGTMPVGKTGSSISTIVDPIHIVLQFVKSSKWPDSVASVRMTKVAFLAQIANELVGLGMHCEVSHTFVDIFYGGCVFRASLYCEKEQTLLQHKPEYSSIIIAQRNAPTHSSLMHAIQLNNNTFGHTVRLVWRWLDRFSLTHHLPLEALELITAYVYANEVAPNSMFSGFLRVLQFISNFNWEHAPLVVALQGTMDKSMIEVIEKEFKQSSSPMFIAASYEQAYGHSLWTENAPSASTLPFIVKMAKETYQNTLAWLSLGFPTDQFDMIFKTSFDGFDAILELHEDYLPISASFQAKYYKNTSTTNSSKLLVGFNPVSTYLRLLTENYRSFATFFTNSSQMNQIKVLWNGTKCNETQVRVMHSHHMVPLTEKTTETTQNTIFGKIDKLQILYQMQALGNGIVKNIHHQEEEI